MGGRYEDTDHDSSAFGGARDLGYVVNISGTTPVPADFDAERQWVRDYWSALVEHATGTGSYVNFMSDVDTDRVRNAYGDKYPRLQQIKSTYDPDNVFHLNTNIAPST